MAISFISFKAILKNQNSFKLSAYWFNDSQFWFKLTL